jgi:hypothetical protein
MIASVLIAVAVLIALAFWWRQHGKRQHPRASRARDLAGTSNDYRCVELRYPGDACDAVKRIGAKRFLPGEAPGIPVPGCDAARCTCRYAHHEDRRHDDRRHPFAQQASEPPSSAGGERRTKKDRRKSAKTAIRPKVGR